jgi:hypothetical protein
MVGGGIELAGFCRRTRGVRTLGAVISPKVMPRSERPRQACSGYDIVMDLELTDKIAIVTGASKGIGLAIT